MSSQSEAGKSGGKQADEQPDAEPDAPCDCRVCRAASAAGSAGRRRVAAVAARVQRSLRALSSSVGGGADSPCDGQQPQAHAAPDPKLARMADWLVDRDPGALYNALEDVGRQQVQDAQNRLLAQLKDTGLGKREHCRAFVLAMCREFERLRRTAKRQSEVIRTLEATHLSEMDLSWELLCQHWFHSLVYCCDQMRAVHCVLMERLKPLPDERETPSPLKRFLELDSAMSDVAKRWRKAQQLLDTWQERNCPPPTAAACLGLAEDLLSDESLMRQLYKMHVSQGGQLNGTGSPSSEPAGAGSPTAGGLDGLLSASSSSSYTCMKCRRTLCACSVCSFSHYVTCGMRPGFVDADTADNEVASEERRRRRRRRRQQQQQQQREESGSRKSCDCASDSSGSSASSCSSLDRLSLSDSSSFCSTSSSPRSSRSCSPYSAAASAEILLDNRGRGRHRRRDAAAASVASAVIESAAADVASSCVGRRRGVSLSPSTGGASPNARGGGGGGAVSPSSTSPNSKFCDCCYCEVFGHAGGAAAGVGQQPAVPPKFFEKREQLRQKLKRKKEQQEQQQQQQQREASQQRQTQPTAGGAGDIDELVKFIEGEAAASAAATSAKREAKKARQKAKKAAAAAAAATSVTAAADKPPEGEDSKPKSPPPLLEPVAREPAGNGDEPVASNQQQQQQAPPVAVPAASKTDQQQRQEAPAERRPGSKFGCSIGIRPRSFPAHPIGSHQQPLATVANGAIGAKQRHPNSFQLNQPQQYFNQQQQRQIRHPIRQQAYQQNRQQQPQQMYSFGRSRTFAPSPGAIASSIQQQPHHQFRQQHRPQLGFQQHPARQQQQQQPRWLAQKQNQSAGSNGGAREDIEEVFKPRLGSCEGEEVDPVVEQFKSFVMNVEAPKERQKVCLDINSLALSKRK